MYAIRTACRIVAPKYEIPYMMYPMEKYPGLKCPWRGERQQIQALRNHFNNCKHFQTQATGDLFRFRADKLTADQSRAAGINPSESKGPPLLRRPIKGYPLLNHSASFCPCSKSSLSDLLKMSNPSSATEEIPVNMPT